MSFEDLAKTLHQMYNTAPKGDKAIIPQLFGIKYCNEITTYKYSKSELAKAAHISESYGTEISKGVKIAKYVHLM